MRNSPAECLLIEFMKILAREETRALSGDFAFVIVSGMSFEAFSIKVSHSF